MKGNISVYGAAAVFTFFWIDANRWEGRNYVITVR
jgi:hypothetical protein